jgi:hypothetical protein
VEVIYDSSFVVSAGLLNVTLVVFHNTRWGEWSCSWFPGLAPKAWRVRNILANISPLPPPSLSSALVHIFDISRV